jgi:uncharacterized protein YrrD
LSDFEDREKLKGVNMTIAKELRKKQVIATLEGKNLGKVKDIYFDSNVTRVTALYLGSRGLIMRKKLVIEGSKLQSCGIDTCMVPKADLVKELKKVTGYREFILARELEGRSIVSEGGTEIATVDSILLDDDFNVIGFKLDKMPDSGPIASRKAIAREAISSIGNGGPMITTLADAESMELRA